MTVYRISGKVHASIDWYMLVHTGTTVYILFLLFCPLLYPAGPPESSGPASAKTHPFQATTSFKFFFHAFLWLLLVAAQPAAPSCGRELDGDVVGGDKFVLESRARAPSILRMPS
jgi:hypothetical protein